MHQWIQVKGVGESTSLELTGGVLGIRRSIWTDWLWVWILALCNARGAVRPFLFWFMFTL